MSRALDPEARVRLAEDVVRRVRETATRMGYRKNTLARSLRIRRTMTVGMMLPDITNTLFAPIVRGAESVLEPEGYASILVNTDDDPVRERTLLDVLLGRGVDGIIDVAAHRSSPDVEAVAATGVPVVTANRRIERSAIPSVVNDDEEGIRLLLHLLRSRGHRRIAHVAGPVALSTGALRLRSVRRQAAELGLELPADAVAVSGRFDEAEGCRCTTELLAGRRDFTAIVCANDRLALGAIDALGRAGLACPEDMSVTGFNDLPFLDLIPPGLTTVRVGQFDVGRLSAEILLQLMTAPEAPVTGSRILPVSLVERGSVAAPAGAGRGGSPQSRPGG